MLKGKIGLGPMADYSDYPFRKLCMRFGADFTITEMISADALVRGNETTIKMLPKPDESNVGIQLFGHDPVTLTEAAKIAAPYGDWLDLNAGCPVSKVVRRSAGSGLLRNLDLLSDIIYSMKNAVDKPVGVKVRIGYNDINIFDTLKAVQHAGADYVIVHGRTTKQLYTGISNREIFTEIRKQTKILLGASGDVYTQEDAREYMEGYRSDFVIVARGTIGNPWYFSGRTPGLEEVKTIVEEHISAIMKHYDTYPEHACISMFNKFLVKYVNGFEGAREVRRALSELKSYKDVENILEILKEPRLT